MQQSEAFKSEDPHLLKSFKVIALKNKAHDFIIDYVILTAMCFCR